MVLLCFWFHLFSRSFSGYTSRWKHYFWNCVPTETSWKRRKYNIYTFKQRLRTIPSKLKKVTNLWRILWNYESFESMKFLRAVLTRHIKEKEEKSKAIKYLLIFLNACNLAYWGYDANNRNNHPLCDICVISCCFSARQNSCYTSFMNPINVTLTY